MGEALGIGLHAMKIAAVYAVFNEEEYIAYSIRSVRDAVDQVVVLINERPWSRSGAVVNGYPVDRTESLVKELAAHDSRLVVMKGSWPTEVAHRQAGMAYCVQNGFDYYFLVDGDEVYRPDHLQAMLEELRAHPNVGTFFIKCTIFWRSFRYRIPHEAMKWTPWRVFKVQRRRRLLGLPLLAATRVIGDNKTDSQGPRYLVPPERCIFYHFSYARSEAKMRQKITTFSVANQVHADWFERVWLGWPQQRGMRNIHPMVPEEFPMAQEVDRADLPAVMAAHPYAGVEIIR